MSTEVRLRYPIQIQKGQRMSEPQNGRGALFAGGLAAILASTCCLGPLVLVALGFSGAWIGNLTVLEPYRPLFIGAAVAPVWAATQTVTLAVPGMTCAACPITVKKALSKVEGVSKVDVGFEKREAVVTFDDTKASVQRLTKATADAGYPSSVKQ
ncbi:mercury resistance system periplasmic binding protein MerP [Escherichia coli]